MTMTCKQDYGKLKGILYLENYDHIMCRSIRVHKHKKQFERIGVIEPQKHAEEMY